MADAFSLIARLVGVRTATIQTFKVLIELATDIRDAPKDLTFVYNDVYTFYSTISVLLIVLDDEHVQSTICGNSVMLEMITNLKASINNCKTVLQQLKAKMEKLC